MQDNANGEQGFANHSTHLSEKFRKNPLRKPTYT